RPDGDSRTSAAAWPARRSADTPARRHPTRAASARTVGWSPRGSWWPLQFDDLEEAHLVQRFPHFGPLTLGHRLPVLVPPGALVRLLGPGRGRPETGVEQPVV